MIGTIFIIVGLYTVVWGKSKDKRMADDDRKGLPIKFPVKEVDAGRVLAGKSEMKTKEDQETNKANQAEI